jgi:subfamily B ATP-binding cassette protein MsbA
MDVALLLALIGILTSIHPAMTILSLALMPIYVLALRAMGPRIRHSSQEVQQRLEVLSGELHEKVAGVAIVKGFARESAETRRFAAHADKLLQRVLHSVKFTAANEVAVGFVVHTTPVLVVWYGVHQILTGDLTVGALTQFLLYLGMFYYPLQRLSDLSVVLSNALAAIDRIFEYFDTQPHVAEHPKARRLTECHGRIDFENVQFGYDAQMPILKDVNLTILPGQTVAFVGPSGAGKSTLASLVPRFYDPTGGALLLGGVDARALRVAELRAAVAIVTQRPVLFSATLRENLTLARPDASWEEVLAACGAAGVADFVDDLPRGYDTAIGERGVNLSGGQRQRVALARALVSDARMLVLDDPLSAVDTVTERALVERLRPALEGRTVLVAAQRLSTLALADRVAVLVDGRVVEQGTTEELLAAGGAFAALFGEEAALV